VHGDAHGTDKTHPTTSSQFSLSPPCSDCQRGSRHGILLTVVRWSIFKGRSPLFPSVGHPPHPIDLVCPLERLQGVHRLISLTGRLHLPSTYRSTITATLHVGDKCPCRHGTHDLDARRGHSEAKAPKLCIEPTRGPEHSKGSDQKHYRGNCITVPRKQVGKARP